MGNNTKKTRVVKIEPSEILPLKKEKLLPKDDRHNKTQKNIVLTKSYRPKTVQNNVSAFKQFL